MPHKCVDDAALVRHTPPKPHPAAREQPVTPTHTAHGLTAAYRDTAHGPFITVTGEGLTQPAEFTTNRKSKRLLVDAVEYVKARIVDVEHAA